MKDVFTGIMILAVGILSLASGFCPITKEKNKLLIQMPQRIKTICLLNILNQPDDPPGRSLINSGASTYLYATVASGTTASGIVSPSHSPEIPGTTTTTT